LHIGAILVLAQAIGVSLNLSLGRELPGIWLVAAPFIGALLWPAISMVLALPRLRLNSPRIIG
jgi:cell shape-determining protein MreD